MGPPAAKTAGGVSTRWAWVSTPGATVIEIVGSGVAAPSDMSLRTPSTAASSRSVSEGRAFASGVSVDDIVQNWVVIEMSREYREQGGG